MEKPQTWFTSIKHLTHLTGQVYRCVCFIGYFCLLIITTIAIIKANVMIVTDTKPAKSKFIINNNVCTPIIRLTSSYVGGKPHLLILISYKLYYTVFIYKKQAKFIKNRKIFLHNNF